VLSLTASVAINVRETALLSLARRSLAILLTDKISMSQLLRANATREREIERESAWHAKEFITEFKPFTLHAAIATPFQLSLPLSRAIRLSPPPGGWWVAGGDGRLLKWYINK